MKDYQLTGDSPRKVAPALTDDSLMPFGKHRGERLEDIKADYFLWLWSEGVEHPGVRGYIIQSFDALVKECPDKIVTPPSDRERALYK